LLTFVFVKPLAAATLTAVLAAFAVPPSPSEPAKSLPQQYKTLVLIAHAEVAPLTTFATPLFVNGAASGIATGGHIGLAEPAGDEIPPLFAPKQRTTPASTTHVLSSPTDIESTLPFVNPPPSGTIVATLRKALS
jgi:hypothetical protein